MSNGSDSALSLISAQTAGATSDEFLLPGGKHVTILAGVLAGVEEVHLQMKNSAGTWVEVIDAGVPLVATSNATGIFAKGVYRVVKDATVGAAYVDIFGAQFKER